MITRRNSRCISKNEEEERVREREMGTRTTRALITPRVNVFHFYGTSGA